MNDEPSRSFSIPELAAVAALALLIVTGAAIIRRGETENKQAEHGSIPTALARIEAAKAQYAADNRLPQNTWLTLSALQKSGYLTAPDGLPHDVHFVPGKVGENATYHFADGPHKDHPKPQR